MQLCENELCCNPTLLINLLNLELITDSNAFYLSHPTCHFNINKYFLAKENIRLVVSYDVLHDKRSYVLIKSI